MYGMIQVFQPRSKMESEASAESTRALDNLEYRTVVVCSISSVDFVPYHFVVGYSMTPVAISAHLVWSSEALAHDSLRTSLGL